MENRPLLFRCSSLGKLMTEPQSKADREAGRLSKTATAYLDAFLFKYKYNREKPFSNKYTIKGTQVEKSGIDLYCEVYGEFALKNTEWFNDDTIGGTPDIIFKNKVVDIKSSWDAVSFMAQKEVNKDYYWQLCGYCRLLNLTKAELVFCLSNTPETLIQKEFMAEYYKNEMRDLTDDQKAYIAHNMVFTSHWYDRDVSGNLVKRNDYWDVLKSAHFPDTDIEFKEVPAEKRIKKFDIEFTDEDFEKLDNALQRSIEYIEENYNSI